MTATNDSASQPLLPHQEAFAKQLLRPDAPTIQVLSAPAGSGTSTTACEIIRRILGQNQPQRTLYLGDNTALVEQICQRLHSVGINPIMVTRYRYRELAEESGSSPWARPGAYIATLQFALQDDVAETIAQAGWDLVIIDSPLRASDRQTVFLEDIFANLGSGRALILLNTSAGDELPAPLQDATTTTWRFQDMVDFTGQPLWQPGQFTLETIPYKSSKEAHKTLKQLDDLFLRIGIVFGESQSRSLSASLLGPKDLFSYEPRLRDLYSRLRQHRNLIAHGRESDVGYERDLGVLESLLLDVEKTLTTIESQESDPKIDAVIGRLKRIQGKGQRTVITTSMLATTNYLSEALDEEFNEVSSLSGSMPAAERSAGLERFQSTGGILIATEAILQGIDFREVNTLIPYDAPRTDRRALVLLSRFLRISRNKSLAILVPTEASEGHESLSIFHQALNSLTAQ